jgi:hypothetical protein
MRAFFVLSMLAAAACSGPIGDTTTGSDSSATGESDETGGPECAADRRPEGAPADEEVLVSLIDHGTEAMPGWTQIEAEADDPIALHRPAMVDCDATGWAIEFDGFEVETLSCNYMAATQSTLVDLCAGDVVEFDFQHFNLVAAQKVEFHAAVFVGDQALLDHTVSVEPEVDFCGDSPGCVPANKFVERIEIAQDLPAGTPVYLHVHNHGFNTFKLLRVDLVLPPE